MTDKEAIKYLQQLYPNGGHCWLDEQRIDAIDMAVKALQGEPKKKCMYSNDNYTDEERKVLCDGCEEKCEYSKKEEHVSEDFEKIVEEIAEPTILNAYGTKELARRLRNTICGTSVSEDLEEASKEWLRPQLDKSYANYGEVKMMELTHFDGYAMLNAIEFGAEWQKTKDESTTENLGEYINELSKQFPEVSFAKLSRIAVRVAQWQKEHLWKPADGDDLPEYDREVIAILDYDFGHYKVVYAHRPNPNGWDGTNIDTGEKEHFEPEIYDKGGWNQPHILYWLDARLPYEENKIDKK